MNPSIQYITSVPPDKVGPCGKAWKYNLASPSRPHTTIAYWIVECPGAHPVWGNYVVSAVHLRPAEGLPPAKLTLEGATHEAVVVALNPDRIPSLSSNDGPQHILGTNFAGQWIAKDDADAEAKIEKCVDEILAGTLNPDTDAMEQWVERFSDSNLPFE